MSPLQSQLLETILSTHDLAELRSVIAEIKKNLYTKSGTDFDRSLQAVIPLKFSLLYSSIAATKSVTEQEKQLTTLDASLASLEILHLTLPYSPTQKQLQDFQTLFKKQYKNPFILKVTTNNTTLGEVTWEVSGERHHRSAFETSKGAAS